MNQERQQAYLNLIQSLLNCHSNDEILEILTVNQDLLDAGFLEMVESAVEKFSQQGDENTANWLQGLASYLREALNRDTEIDLQSLSEEETQAYYEFLMELLQATAESNGNAQVIYPLLAKNTDKLDGVFAEILRRWGINTLREAEVAQKKYVGTVIILFCIRLSEFPLGNKARNMEIAITGYELVLTVFTRQAFPYEWAMTQNNLGFAYWNRIRGEKAENIENAITAYTTALIVRTRQAFPYEWAQTQNNLGNAYSNRIIGEKAENLENAIAAYTAALIVRTHEAFPQDWAMTQNNLGIAYWNRIRGEKAENLENAIAAYTAALTVYTRQAFPQDWAATQNNLGHVYRSRIRGKKAENLEQAIACYTQALEERTRDRFPYEWAKMQNNLGIAYNDRIAGEKRENLEQAIAYYTQALKEYTRDRFPHEWAKTQINLGLAYSNRITGEKRDNLEQAIACYTQALEERTRNRFPYEWAQTQSNLGIAYSNRIAGEKRENLEQAISCYTQALKVMTFDAFPEDWANTRNNLGSAYAQRIGGEEAENLEQAIACYTQALKVMTFDAFPQDWANVQNNLSQAYRRRIRGEKAKNLEIAFICCQEALKVYTFDAFPQDWAGTQHNLANVYAERIRGERAENLERALACYQKALKVTTFDGFPQNHTATLFSLGRLYQQTNQFTLGYDIFAQAITAVESLREEIVSGEETKRKQAEEWNQLYRNMVEVCLELGNITQAIEYVEHSKTRNLVEQILERDSKTIFPKEVVTQLEIYRDEIATGQYQIQNGKVENPQELAQHLQQLRQQRNELQNRYLPVGYAFKCDSFQPTLDDSTTILEWYILNNKILAFIVTQKGDVKVWQSQPKDLEALIDWVNRYLQNYYIQKDEWQNQLGEELNKLAAILHIDDILKQIPNYCDKLILIPYRFLHLFPLHALPISQNSENSSCLLDLFAGGVSYVPSCQLLQQVQKRERPNFQSLFAIQNPTEDLNYTDLEIQVIQRYFNTANVLKKTAAILTAINNTDLNTYHCTHFSCHGYFNLTNPGRSALILANAPVIDTPTKPDSERYLNVRLGETHDLDQCLTLDKIFTLKLEKCRLVTLSACETGLIDFKNTSDEYIGLPSGFLLAGSPSVVSSLWKVNDLSTSFLMIKFYENLFKLDRLEAVDIAIALKQAQTWLRNLTIERLDKFLEEHKSQIEKVLAQLRVGQRIRFQESLKLIKERQTLPFANPYYWAGFTASGL